MNRYLSAGLIVSVLVAGYVVLMDDEEINKIEDIKIDSVKKVIEKPKNSTIAIEYEQEDDSKKEEKTNKKHKKSEVVENDDNDWQEQGEVKYKVEVEEQEDMDENLPPAPPVIISKKIGDEIINITVPPNVKGDILVKTKDGTKKFPVDTTSSPTVVDDLPGVAH